MKGKTLSKRVIVLVTMASLMSSTVAFGQDIKKDETVYVILKDNGEVQESIVSDWIRGEENLGTIKDKSNLKDIKNVKGEENPELSGENLTWTIDGTDLYYSGKSEKALPIDVDIKYELNGKEVNPAEVKGKSGSFKITLSVKNKEKKTVKINGEDRELYVPFLVASEIIMPNDNFQKVKTDGGKLISDGNNNDITFISVPGLKESLKLDDLIDLKEDLVIEGETSDFAVPSIVLMATTGGLDLENLDASDDLNTLKDSLNQLSEGGESLLKGAAELSKGQQELSSKYTQFNEGVSTLNKGAVALSDGINSLASKAPEIKTGVEKVSNGLSALTSAQNDFTQGINGYRDKVVAFIKAYGNIDGGINKALVGTTQLKHELGTKAGQIDELTASTESLQQIAGKLSEMSKAYESTDKTTAATLKALGDNINKIAEGQKAGAGELKSGMGQAIGGLSTLEAGLSELSKGSKEFANNGQLIAGGADLLSQNSSKIGAVTNQLATGGKELSKGTDTLLTGAGQLKSGGDTLRDGSNTLYDNSAQVLAGINKLAAGSNELYEGVAKLKEEGLDKLSDKGNTALGDIDGLIATKDELVKLSKEYGTFSGLEEGMTGNVKFIMRINDENKASTTPKVQAAKEEEKAKDGTKKDDEVSKEKGTSLIQNIIAFFKK